MKKTILSVMTVLGAVASFAQNNNSHVPHQLNCNSQKIYGIDAPAKTAAGHHTGARTTTVTIASENFGSGTDTTLPTGWTSGIINGTGTWHWADWASTSPNTMGLMSSATAGNGWMIFDADSINTDCSCTPSAWLQSPAYNCSGHTTVRLNFEEYYGHVYDTTEIWVSTSPTFSTYTVYSLPLNNSLIFGNTTANIAQMHVNITSAAAGHSAVYIRFVYRGDNFFDLSWMVDDLTITELDPHDAGVVGSFMLAPDPTAYTGSICNTPLAFVDSFVPGTFLSNYGYSNETNVPVTANIFKGITNVYTQTGLFPSLPENVTDTAMFFPKFKPATTGDYTYILNSSLSGDADSTNNLDTVRFNVTDTTWMQNDTAVASSYFVYLTAGIFPGVPAYASMMGTRFDVPSSSVGDTVSGFGVAFSPITRPSGPLGKVSIQLYSKHKTDTSWTYMGTSVSRSLTAADTSSFTAIKWADFRIDTAASGGIAPFILQPGTSYAAMLQFNHISTLVALFTANSNTITGMNNGIMLMDTSRNNGDHGYHPGASDSGVNGMVPFIRMYFGTIPLDRTGINNVNQSISSLPAYPDPANSIINIPVLSRADETVTATLSNMTGQVLRTRTIRVPGGVKTTVTFKTDDLANGVYNYSLSANGAHTNGTIIIAH